MRADPSSNAATIDTALPGAHDHRFGHERVRPGQGRTALVLGLTVVTMAGEIVSGLAFGSIALLADGLHMGSHTAALGVALFAYALVRRYAGDPRFSFGTGKVNALAGFASALLLAGIALLMLWESVSRWRSPVPISFDQALLVALLGLVVNGVSARLLGPHGHAEPAAEFADPGRSAGRGHDPGYAHGHHGHDHGPARSHDHAGVHDRGRGHHHHGDHNLQAAYLHVLADALTSVLAIVALIAAKYAGAAWMDPAMGVLGALIVLRWSSGLARSTAGVLLDHQADPRRLEAIRAAIERGPGERLLDLHVWSIGADLWAGELAVQTDGHQTADDYRARLPSAWGLVHVLVEVRPDGRRAPDPR